MAPMAVPATQGPPPTRMEGVVKAIMESKRFGFISAEGREYFFHASAVHEGLEFESLKPGDMVTFLPTEGKSGDRDRAVGVERKK